MTALQIKVLTINSGDLFESEPHGGRRTLTFIGLLTNLNGMHAHTCHSSTRIHK